MQVTREQPVERVGSSSHAKTIKCLKDRICIDTNSVRPRQAAVVVFYPRDRDGGNDLADARSDRLHLDRNGGNWIHLLGLVLESKKTA